MATKSSTTSKRDKMYSERQKQKAGTIKNSFTPGFIERGISYKYGGKKRRKKVV